MPQPGHWLGQCQLGAWGLGHYGGILVPRQAVLQHEGKRMSFLFL